MCMALMPPRSTLTIAQEKAAEANTPILFLCQRMEELDLFGTIDTVVCTLDSINHLTEERYLAGISACSTFFGS